MTTNGIQFLVVIPHLIGSAELITRHSRGITNLLWALCASTYIITSRASSSFSIIHYIYLLLMTSLAVLVVQGKTQYYIPTYHESIKTII